MHLYHAYKIFKGRLAIIIMSLSWTFFSFHQHTNTGLTLPKAPLSIFFFYPLISILHSSAITASPINNQSVVKKKNDKEKQNLVCVMMYRVFHKF